MFAAAWSPDPARQLPDPRRALQGELAALRTVHADALADAGGADAGWPVSAAAEELAFLALSLPAQRPAPPPTVARAFLGHLDELGAAPHRTGPTADPRAGAPGSSPHGGRDRGPDDSGGGHPGLVGDGSPWMSLGEPMPAVVGGEPGQRGNEGETDTARGGTR